MEINLREKSILRRPWLLLSIAVSTVCLLLVMFSFNYVDGELTRDWSLQLLDCLFQKTDMEFYHYSQQCMSYDCCDKTIWMMLPISLWNLPIWVIHQITGNEYLIGFGCILWMKIGYLLCMVVICIECTKIVKRVNPESDSMLIYPLILGSFDILNSAIYAAQDEIIYISMLVTALRFLIEKRFKIFLLFATITVTLNPEMIIPVLLLIVFIEKRIHFVLLDLILTIIPSTLFSVLYKSNEVYNRYNWIDRASDSMKNLFVSDIGLSQSMGNVSLFLIVICLLLFYSYTRRNEGGDYSDSTWIMGVIMTSMTLLSSGSFMNYFYRSFLYVPFLVLVIISSKHNTHTNLLLYLIYTWIRSWLDLLNCKIQNFSSPYLTIDNDFVQRVFDKSRIVSPGRFMSREIPVLGNYGAFSAICFSVAVIIFFINYKGHQDRVYNTFKPNKDALVFVTGLFIPLVMGLFAYSMIKSDKYDKIILFGTANNDEYYEESIGYDFYNNNGICTYAHSIVYFDGICMINGEDVNGYRTINEGGSSFGPYISLYPGTYRITISGTNLNEAVFDCTYNEDFQPNILPVEVIEQTTNNIIYSFRIEEKTDNIETRLFNYSSDPVEVYSIHIDELTE